MTDLFVGPCDGGPYDGTPLEFDGPFYRVPFQDLDTGHLVIGVYVWDRYNLKWVWKKPLLK